MPLSTYTTNATEYELCHPDPGLAFGVLPSFNKVVERLHGLNVRYLRKPGAPPFFLPNFSIHLWNNTHPLSGGHPRSTAALQIAIRDSIVKRILY